MQRKEHVLFGYNAPILVVNISSVYFSCVLFPFYGSGKRQNIYECKYRAEMFKPPQLRRTDHLVSTRL